MFKVILLLAIIFIPGVLINVIFDVPDDLIWIGPLISGIVFFGIFIIQGTSGARKEKAVEREIKDSWHKVGLSLNNCVYSLYSCSFYKENDCLIWIYKGLELPNGFERTGYIDLKQYNVYSLVYHTNYSNLVAMENMFNLMALGELFGAGIIFDVSNEDDNYVKDITMKVDSTTNTISIPVLIGFVKSCFSLSAPKIRLTFSSSPS